MFSYLLSYTVLYYLYNNPVVHTPKERFRNYCKAEKTTVIQRYYPRLFTYLLLLEDFGVVLILGWS
jgi:hypothetical protein